METRRDASAGILRPALAALVIWALLVVVWNVAGVLLINAGHRSPGPTASLTGAFVTIGLLAALLMASRRRPGVYALLALASAALAALPVINALRADPSLWPSEFWRYAGIAINLTGCLGGIAAFVGWLRWRAGR